MADHTVQRPPPHRGLQSIDLDPFGLGLLDWFLLRDGDGKDPLRQVRGHGLRVNTLREDESPLELVGSPFLSNCCGFSSLLHELRMSGPANAHGALMNLNLDIIRSTTWSIHCNLD